MPLLLDANIWLPLVWDGHVANPTVHQWAAEQREGFVLCRVMQLALLRHLTNPSIMKGDVCNNEEAARLFTELLSQKAIVFNPEPAGMEIHFPTCGVSKTPQRNRWTDAYLAAFAIAGNYRLISFDGGFSHYESQGLRWSLLEINK